LRRRPGQGQKCPMRTKRPGPSKGPGPNSSGRKDIQEKKESTGNERRERRRGVRERRRRRVAACLRGREKEKAGLVKSEKGGKANSLATRWERSKGKNPKHQLGRGAGDKPAGARLSGSKHFTSSQKKKRVSTFGHRAGIWHTQSWDQEHEKGTIVPKKGRKQLGYGKTEKQGNRRVAPAVVAKEGPIATQKRRRKPPVGGVFGRKGLRQGRKRVGTMRGINS